MRLRAAVLSVLLPASMLAAVAAAPSASDCRDLEGQPVCRTPVYLQCTNEAPLLHVQANDGNATWSYDAPTGSFQAGEGGCGEFDETLFGETSQDGVNYSFDMVGQVEGNLDEMTVELHNLDIGQGRAAPVKIQARITIDGKSPFGTEQLLDVTGEPHANPTRVTIEVTPEEANSGATMVYRFTVTGLNASLGTVNPENPDKNRHVIITIDVSTDDAPKEGRAPDYVGFNPWVWGATEIPSGVLFNGLEGDPKGTIVEAVPAEA